MTKQEFEILIGKPMDAESFEKIQFVYTFHPSISETEGKKQIADLFMIFGLRIINDMYPTACKAKALEEDIRKKVLELENLRENLVALKRGEIFPS